MEIKANINDLKLIKKAEMLYDCLKNKYNAILSAEEVAELLNTKVSTIRVWTYKNIIPHKKISGFVKYILSDIVFWLVENNVEKINDVEKVKRKRGRPRKEESFKKAGII